MNAWLVLRAGILLSILVNSLNSERICFSCSGIRQDEQCQHAIKCNKDEICFVQKYYTIGNETKYDAGCTFHELCQKDITGHILGKRDGHAHIVCQKCCNDSNVCNYDLSCQNTIKRQKCLSCDNLDNPKVCNSTVTCGKEEVCFLHEYLTETQHVKYDLGCKHSTLCLHGSKTNYFGRRSSNDRHLACERCCGGTEICNIDLQCGNQEHKSHGEVCTDKSQCQSSLQCIRNMCTCHFTQYWNGTACFQRKNINGTCNASLECLDSLFCLHGKCNCDHAFDYWMGSACTKRKSFDSSCTSNEECETFRCIDSKCACALVSEYWSGSQCLRGIECADLAIEKDGIYTIYPSGKNKPVQVFCVVRQHDKWTVIQRRVNGSVDFYRTWNEYKHGFGSAYGEYWLGNDNIHLISTIGQHELSIYMEIDDGRHITANYSTFRVSDEPSLYVLTVTGYSGKTGQNAMDPPTVSFSSNGKPFTTKDRDNDEENGNLAVSLKSAWWYSSNYNSDLNKAFVGQTGTMYWANWRLKSAKRMAEISKAEYLKRYLSGPEENEKKKKRRKVVKSNSKHIRSTIIDDDVDLKSLLPENLENTLDEDIGEDDPTIVAIIDERPDTIQQLETYRHSDGRWKTLGKDDDFDPSLLKSMKDEDILKNTKSFFKNKRESEYNKKSVSRQSDLPRRKRHDSDSDNSLPRKHRHDSDSDQSLPRNQRHDSDSDQSLPRKQRHDSYSDSSPARKPKTLIRKSRFEPRKRLDSDESPPRRQRHDSGSDKSPPRRKRHESGSDQSPPRRIRKDSGSDQSPPRRKRNDSDSDQSPPRKKDKMSKTLSGKKAGLQSAKDMKMEAEKMKKKEDDAFKKISNDALGRDAVTVFRDRKTGKRRNMEDEAEKNAEQLEKERQMKEKYEKWGKGMKQQEQQQINVEEHLHEASKPMARFKDDDDLDKHLKEITRADDPMLKFLKKKKPKDSKKKELPKYKGAPPPPNRFNMMPGYRWDGVDRSNGFEAKYFASISNKKAITEDAYKWSVEDM